MIQIAHYRLVNISGYDGELQSFLTLPLTNGHITPTAFAALDSNKIIPAAK